MSAPPVMWSVAGMDSAGGAGLSADQRAADALGVHLCPVLATVTAQNSLTVEAIDPVPTATLQAQFDALSTDLPPAVIKTGLLGSVDHIQILAQTVDRLRRHSPVALVVDPVLRSSTQVSFADDKLIRAYRDCLLPRATVLTPNRSEAASLLQRDPLNTAQVPEAAQALQAFGARSVCITGGDHAHHLSQDWLLSPHAQGWLSLARVDTPHTHGTGCTFASALAAALALGFVDADAAVIAKMITTHALRQARAAGQGAGPVRAGAGFGTDPTLLPRLSLDTHPHQPARDKTGPPSAPYRAQLYAIVDNAQAVAAAAQAGATTIQLRRKPPASASPALSRSAHPPPQTDQAWQADLRDQIQRSLQATSDCGARLVVNDHWREAIALGATMIHLGQDDLLSFGAEDWAQLNAARAKGLALGLSTHSLWELCRAHTVQPAYIACGPVWPTLTKAMPWRPQGLDNLRWWTHMAPAPVVAIGGILAPAQLQAVAAHGAQGGCVVRGLGPDPGQTLPLWQAAWAEGCRQARAHLPAPPALPHPCLPPG